MKRRRVILIASIIIILLTSTFGLIWYTISNPRYWNQGWVEETGGLSYVSEIYGPESNASYTINFHNVNFTFMYWTYPYGWLDVAYTAYFLIEFLDNTSEIVTFLTGSWWLTSGSLKRPLFAVAAEHTDPIAGVLAGGYLDSPVGWQFVVSMN